MLDGGQFGVGTDDLVPYPAGQRLSSVGGLARIDYALLVAKLAEPRERGLEPPLGAAHFLFRILQSVAARPRRQIIDQLLRRPEDRLRQLQGIVRREGLGPNDDR